MRSIFKTLVLYLLVIIMLITNTFVSLAVEGNVDNNNNQSANLGGGGDFSTSAQKFGYRVSLISKQDPEQILSVNESGEPVVIDFWFCSKAQFNQYTTTNAITNLTAENVHSSIKTQTLNTQNKIKRVFIADELAKNPESILATVPRWIGYKNKSWVTYGKELQQWETENEYQNIARMATELYYEVDGKNYPLFATKDTLNKTASDGKPLNVLSKDVESNKDIVLLIEPLLLFTPCYYNTSIPLMQKQYGTVTNILEAMWDNANFQKEYAKNEHYNHLNYKLTDVAWCALNLSAEQAFTFDDGRKLQQLLYFSPEMGLGTYKGKFDWIYAAEIRDWTNGFKDGWGCNLFWLSGILEKIPDEAQIHTYDITTNPVVDYYTEPSKDKKESDDYKENNTKFNIVKYYIYEDSITNEVTEISYYVTTNAPHTVIIDDEQAQTGFSLKEYFTSTDDWLPENDKAPSEYKWESVVKAKHKNGTYSGTDYTTVTVTPENPDKVLHILYTFTGKEAVNIVKVYKNASDEVIKTTGPEVLDKTDKYTVTEESDYEYVETLISKNDPDVSNPEGESTKSKEIHIEQGTKTLYIIYKEPPAQIKLFSNELSYTYELKDLVKSRILFSIYDTVPASPGTSPSCGGHGKRGRKCSLRSHAMVDSMWSVKVSNNYDYNSTSFIREYENTGNLGGRWSTGISGKSITANSSQVAKPNATFLLIRDNIDDLVTLYPHKNNNLLSSLNGLGITAESYSPNGNRMESEAIKDKDFTRTFETDFIYTEHDTSLSWKWPRSKCNRDHGGSYSTQTVTDTEGANKYYSNQNNVKEYYLLGQSNTGSEDVSDMRSDSFGTKYTYNKAYSSTSADLKFYPYHLMLYRAKNSNGSPQNVYVTSENLSTMKVYNAVQLGVYKKNPINSLLSSTQWSTHARSLAFSANTDKKSVAPGGAILDIDMGSKGDTELGIRLWQSCLRDEQVETVQADSFNTSLSKAKEIANNYQSEVKQVLEGYGLVQYGIEGTKTDLNSVLSGTELHNNTSLNWDGRSYKTSNDSKYYLKHDSSGSDRANFDVLDSKVNKQTFYEISSDVDGNVILKKDNTEIARASLTQDKSAILSNTEAKLLDDNTKLISNYFNAIDRGLGDSNKYDRTNSRKYNEAYDGVGVLMTELSFSVGFSDNSGHRTTVLDTLLTSTSESKSDLYNFDESKVRSFVFATTKVSTTAKDTSKNGYLGTLQGDSNMQSLQSVLSDIQSFVYTKNFYTSNFNVTDLN